MQAIQVFYGQVHALKGVSLHIDRGEIVTLIGANGAGKSTTLSAISGLIRPRTGKIIYEGRDLSGVPAYDVVKLGLSQAPEGRKIFPRMSVKENLEMGAFSRTKQDLKADFERVYDLFPVLNERKSQPGGTLSGGEQQMLAMGRALMARPEAAHARRALHGSRAACSWRRSSRSSRRSTPRGPPSSWWSRTPTSPWKCRTAAT